MTAVILKHAERDLEEAFDYLNHQRVGLGLEFATDFLLALERIKVAPLRWPVKRRGARRYYLDRFRYFIWYQVIAERIEVIALWHTSRRPFGWASRM